MGSPLASFLRLVAFEIHSRMRAAAVLAVALLMPNAAPAGPRFADARASLPFEHVYAGGWEHFVGGGVAVLDCNDDGLPDLFAAGGDNPARLFVNASAHDAGLRFTPGRLDDLTGVTGAYPLDIDSDGHTDLAVLRVGSNLLLRGEPGCRFSDATDQWGLGRSDAWTTSFTATWEPDNAWPTLVFGNYVDRDDPEGPFGACDDNALYRPHGRGYGAPVALSPGFCALSMLVSDWRRSGVPELRISNDRHYYVRGGQEEMWRLRPLAPRGEADGWAKLSLWGMGIASADLTGDGLPEVMLTSMGDQVLQFNDGTTFTNAPYAVGASAHRPHVGDDGRPSTGWHAEFGDIDNDGLLDLFIAKGNVDQMPSNAIHDPNNLLMQTPQGTFAERAMPAGIATSERSRGAALADLDGDGLLDIVVVNRRAPMEIWRNVTEDAGNWLAVELRQSGANLAAVGAWVEVRTEAGSQHREVTVGGGHAGGTSGPWHFGLGSAGSADVRVVWPDGTTGAWIAATANQRLTLRR